MTPQNLLTGNQHHLIAQGKAILMTSPDRGERPDILVLCMDQWDAHMDLPPGVDLPAIQRLTGAGVTLENQYCTVPQCTLPRHHVDRPAC